MRKIGISEASFQAAMSDSENNEMVENGVENGGDPLIENDANDGAAEEDEPTDEVVSDPATTSEPASASPKKRGRKKKSPAKKPTKTSSRVESKRAKKRMKKKDESDDDEEDVNYEVGKIIDKRQIKRKIEYKVRWKGYGAKDDTWQAVSDLNCPELIKDFENGLKEQEDEVPAHGTKREASSKVQGSKKKKLNDKDDEEEEEYEVEEILEVKFKKNGSQEFLVRWKGFKASENTWEPAKNLNCHDLINGFMQVVKKTITKFDASDPAISPKKLHAKAIPKRGRPKRK